MHLLEGRKSPYLLYIKQVHRPPSDIKLSNYFLLRGTAYFEIKIQRAQGTQRALPNDSKDEHRKKEDKNEIMENIYVHQGIR